MNNPGVYRYPAGFKASMPWIINKSNVCCAEGHETPHEAGLHFAELIAASWENAQWDWKSEPRNPA